MSTPPDGESAQQVAAQFGANGDVPLLGDFDGDGKSDLAVFRPATAYWFYRRSRDGQLRGIHFGTSSDIPVPGDYDGDSVSDIAIFRPNTGVWYRLNSSDGALVSGQWGTKGDKPVPADTLPPAGAPRQRGRNHPLPVF